MKPRVVSIVAAGAVLALGGLLVMPESAQALACEPGSSICTPAALPILIEAGIISGDGGVVAGATAITIASGGLATLGTFNAAIGIVGAATLVTGGAAVASGLLTQTGMPPGVTLHTAPGVDPVSPSDPCPPSVATGSAFATYAISPLYADCADPMPYVPGYSDVTVTAHSIVSGALHFSGTYTNTLFGGDFFDLFDCGYGGTGSSVPLNVSGGSGVFSGVCNATDAGRPLTVAALVSHPSGSTVDLPFWSTTASGFTPGWHGTIRTTVTCTGPSGDTPATASQPVNVASGGDLHVPTVECPAGDLATAVSIEFAPTTDPTGWLPLTQGATPGSVKSLVTTYPDCFGPGVTPCTMQLQHELGTVWATCGPLATYCPDWVAQATADPSLYRCQYGSYTLGLDSCSAFRRPGSILPNYDLATGTPKPITDPVPSTVGLPAIDPDTGDPAPLPSTDGTPSDDPAECFPTGWGVFNPLAWVLQPIQCAFTPKSDAFTRTGAVIATAWAGTSIAQVLVITSQFSDLHGPTGCDGMPVDISIDWPVHWEIHWTFGDSCPGTPLHTVAGVVSTVLGIGVSIGALYTITRYLGSTIGFGGFKGDKDE